MNSFLVNFCWHLAIFSGHTGSYLNRVDRKIAKLKTKILAKPEFVYFHPFINTATIIVQNWNINGISIGGERGIRTQNQNIVEVDDTAELWWPPKIAKLHPVGSTSSWADGSAERKWNSKIFSKKLFFGGVKNDECPFSHSSYFRFCTQPVWPGVGIKK